MIIFRTSVMALPIVLLVWALDSYMFILALRLILGSARSIHSSRFYLALPQLTDGAAHRVDAWLARVRGKSNPAWLPWLVVVTTLVLVRHALVLCLITRG